MPARVGAFNVLGEISRGGMGVVYRARHSEAHYDVALKLVLGAQLDAEKELRFQREAQALARLRHEHIASVRGYGHEGGQPYFAMELIEGPSLEQWVSRSIKVEGQLPDIDWVLDRITKVGRALAYCHSHGLIHRDLKPANIIIEASSSRPVLIDFGLVRVTEGSESLELLAETLTRSGELLGTPSYMSPEQIEAAHEVGPAADVWALAATLFYALTGQPPFLAATNFALLSKILQHPARKLRELRPESPRWLEGLVEQALHKDPVERLELQRFCDQLEARGEFSIAPSGPGRSRLGLGLIAAALLIVVLGLGWPWGGPSKSAITAPVRPKPKPRAQPKPHVPVKELAMDAADMRSFLNDRELWQGLTEAQRLTIAKAVRKALGAPFRLLGVFRFDCAGVAYDIAVYKHRKTGIPMHLIPGGPFTLGTKDPEAEAEFARRVKGAAVSKADWRKTMGVMERELPARELMVPAFFLAESEISREQVLTIWSRGKNSMPLDQLSWPFDRVDFEIAKDWLAGTKCMRLPTEVEWEYACRAGTKTRYYWGDESVEARAWYLKNSEGRMHSADESKHFKNAFGLVNMLGNVNEWCEDRPFDNYQRGPIDERPVYQGPGFGIQRGGNYLSDAFGIRCAVRRKFRQKRLLTVSGEQRLIDLKGVGFRAAMSLPTWD